MWQKTKQLGGGNCTKSMYEMDQVYGKQLWQRQKGWRVVQKPKWTGCMVNNCGKDKRGRGGEEVNGGEA